MGLHIKLCYDCKQFEENYCRRTLVSYHCDEPRCENYKPVNILYEMIREIERPIKTDSITIKKTLFDYGFKKSDCSIVKRTQRFNNLAEFDEDTFSSFNCCLL